MKTLYILRHGQKEEIEGQDDYDIKLTLKGEEDIKIVAQKLKSKKVLPDLIISSPSLRTRQTAQIVAKELNYTKNIGYNEILYKAFLNELIESISYTYDTINTLMIIGHNPSLSAFVFNFTGFQKRVEMGAVIRIDFDCSSWLDIDKNSAKLIEHIQI